VAFREVDVIEVREVLRAWLAGKGQRSVARQAGVDRKTVVRYVEAAVAAGLARDGGEEQLTDELIGQVIAAVRPDRLNGHGAAWESLEQQHDQIVKWVGGGLTVVKIADLLAREGVVVPARRLHRYCCERTDYRGRSRGGTVPVADGEPGVGVSDRLRLDGHDLRLGDRAAAGGARVDFHRGVLAAHVRVVDVFPDVGGDRRRL